MKKIIAFLRNFVLIFFFQKKFFFLNLKQVKMYSSPQFAILEAFFKPLLSKFGVKKKLGKKNV